MSPNDQPPAKVAQNCPAGTILFHDGERGETMYVLQSGRVRVFKEVAGEQKTLALLGPGEFFGEMAILNDKPRTASAEVIEDARVLIINAQTFGSMVVQNAEIAVRLIRRLARRLDNANELIDILMHRDPRARVILGLAREAEYNGDLQDDGSILIPMDAKGLAQQVGLEPDDVAGVLERLDRLKIAYEGPQGFIVPDVMRLHEFLDFLKTRTRREGS